MENVMRDRLKAAINASNKTFKQISLENGWPETYVSRIVTGEIKRPDPVRLDAICKSVNVPIGYVISGDSIPVEPKSIASDPPSLQHDDILLGKVNSFVKNGGLTQK